MNKLIRLEIQAANNREEFDYREMIRKNEWQNHTSWAMKLFIELSTIDKTKSPNSNKKF